MSRTVRISPLRKRYGNPRRFDPNLTAAYTDRLRTKTHPAAFCPRVISLPVCAPCMCVNIRDGRRNATRTDEIVDDGANINRNGPSARVRVPKHISTYPPLSTV